MKKERTLRLVALLMILVVAVLSSCSANANSYVGVDTHTEEQKAFLSGSYVTLPKGVKGVEEKSRPLPIELDLGSAKAGYKLVIAKKSGEIFLNETLSGGGKYDVYNTELCAEYVWHVENEKGEKTGKSGEFSTADTVIRNLYVDGVTNCRDLGGWKNADGKRVKQGLLYRTGRFNQGGYSETVYITEEGKHVLRDVLGVKTEIDLRTVDNGEAPAILESVLGESVKYVQVSMKTGGNYLVLNKDKLADVFEVFSNADNYPVVFHCSIGTDRTGLVAFLVNAMLGVDEESLYYDYMFSNFGNIGNSRAFTNISDYIKKISVAGGNDLSEKAYNYLVANGVPAQTLDFMRSFLLE